MDKLLWSDGQPCLVLLCKLNVKICYCLYKTVLLIRCSGPVPTKHTVPSILWTPADGDKWCQGGPYVQSEKKREFSCAHLILTVISGNCTVIILCPPLSVRWFLAEVSGRTLENLNYCNGMCYNEQLVKPLHLSCILIRWYELEELSGRHHRDVLPCIGLSELHGTMEPPSSEL